MNSTAASVLSSALHGFFTNYLPQQRAMSPHTLHSYRDSLKLLLRFVAGKKRDPSALAVEHLTGNQILAFLEYVEVGRSNKACTRNVRLTAIHSFFRYLGSLYPEYLEQAQRVLSIPFKRVATREIHHLDLAEIQAVLKSIDRSTPDGRRDLVLLSLLFNTGARVSEVVDLKASDLRLQPPASVLLRGKECHSYCIFLRPRHETTGKHTGQQACDLAFSLADVLRVVRRGIGLGPYTDAHGASRVEPMSEPYPA